MYKYLLDHFTDLGVNEKENIIKPNESSIANQWGQKNNRIFIRRVLRSVLTEYYSEKERISVVPGLTLGKLVEILEGIQAYRTAKRLEIQDSEISLTLTRAEKLRVFRLYYQLTLEEKKILNLPVHSGEAILHEFLLTVTDPNTGLKPEDSLLFYKKITDIFYNSFNQTNFHSRLNISVSVTDIIQKNIEVILEKLYQGINEDLKVQKIKELVRKICNEISRIELQSGFRQYKSLLKNEIITDAEKQNNSLLPPKFIEHLTRCIVENEALSDDFPIHLKHLEIEKIHPLPLYLKTEEQKFGLLNPLLLEDDEDVEDVVGLKNQFAYKIRVHFYIKIPDNYQAWIAGEYHQVSFFNENENKLEFFEEISGIGSPIHNIIAAINRVLLWDIPSLSNYLPLARDILNNNEFFGSSSLVWSYCLVNLCKKSDIEKAIQENKLYDEIISNNEAIYGEYCGFDSVETAAKAALQARLRAIKQTGIKPEIYFTELCHRVEEVNALRQAENYLTFYPFSLKAMEGYLNKTIFYNRYRVVDNNLNFVELNDGKAWSIVAYYAHLTITESYLQEGLYRIAKKYLDVLEPHIIEAKKGKNKCFRDFIFVMYELCQFRYHYLTDLEDIESRESHSDRAIAIRTATDSLNNAEEYLKNILRKYYIVDACGQSNFHPFFYLLSRVYAHRAKLYIFTSSYTDHPGNRWDALIQPIHLLEKARIYAARDANPALSAYWSAYQSWCYLIVAYLGDYNQPTKGFSREECIDWSKRLIDHALICYKKIGKICYQQIKDNGGRITELKKEEDGKYYEHYGDTRIQGVPLIKELSKGSDESEQIYDSDNNVINFDFSIFIDIFTEHKSVYLFGTHSSILLFAMGMLRLCDDEKKESEKLIQIKEAIRMFTYCSAIAEDGNKGKKDNNNEKLYLERIFNKGDSLIRGLYPHRLTQFADLGKIWAATCKSILLLYNSTFDWQDIDELLENLPTSSSKSVLDDNCGQKRYNGHLESHCDRLIQYFEQLKCKRLNLTNLTEIRNKIVRDVFKIMRGESDVKP
ncbi:hypothetical protein NIES2101_29060 [Calothrix sp. HK-06]|nr:hypothetical protein NIES2101_29060 [Calothrix sp. HK-06]